MVRDAQSSATATIIEEPASPTAPGYPLRSPAESVVRINPFDTPLGGRTPNRSRRPSLSDRPSIAETFGASTDYFGRASARPANPKPFFRSRRIRKDEIQTPRELKTNKDPKAKWTWILPLIGIVLGLVISGIIIFFKIKAVSTPHKYCPVLMEDFSSGELNPNIWTIERQVGGYG